MLRHGIMASSPNNFRFSDEGDEDAAAAVAVGADMHLFEGDDTPNLKCCRLVQNILLCSE